MKSWGRSTVLYQMIDRTGTSCCCSFAAFLAESLWLSVHEPQLSEALPRLHRQSLLARNRTDGKPEAFRKDCGIAAATKAATHEPEIKEVLTLPLAS
jgi:hypothetical protein